MKDIRLTIRAKNNILASLREEYGMSQEDMAKMIGISLPAYCGYENMSRNPIHARFGKIRPTAMAIMKFFDMPFRAIWTDGILSIKETTFIAEIDSTLYLNEVDQPLMLPGPEEDIIERDLQEKREILHKLLDRALGTLTLREEKILKEIFYEGKTLEQIGEDFDVSRERIRQLRDNAIRKLKHPSRNIRGGRIMKIIKHEFV